MKYYISDDFRTSTPFEERSSDHLKDLDQLKWLTNFEVNLTSLPRRVMNYTFNTQCTTLLKNEVRLRSNFARTFSLLRSLKRSEDFSLNGVEIMQNVIFRVKL